MDNMRFTIKGHKNVLSTHPTTLEFTKDKELTRNGNCILGIGADFKIDKRILGFKKIKIRIICDGVENSLTTDVNPDFEDEHEIVIRKSGFLSKRTLGINADKASIDVDRRIAEKLKNAGAKAQVVIEEIK